jgi:hypothetical protein
MKRTNTGEVKKLEQSDAKVSDDWLTEYFNEVIGEENMDDDEEFTLTEEQELEVELTTVSRFNAGLDKPRKEKSKKMKTVTTSSDGKEEMLTKREKEEWEKTEKEFGEGNDEYDERELQDWTEKGFQGTLGEILARKAFAGKGLKTIDLNELALNFGGLDNISNDPQYPFEQTKLHLAETTATVETYTAHLQKADTYAIKAVRYLQKHQKQLKTLIEKNSDFKDHALLSTMLSQLGKLEGKGDDDIEGSEAHKTVSEAMIFSVPSDVYDKLDAKIKHRFISLGKTVKELNDFKKYMADDYRPTPAKKTDDEKDGDFKEL